MKLPIFDAQSHTYTLAGRVIPSVTQVLKAAGIIDTTGYTDEARDRGAAIHAAIHYAIDRDLDESSVDLICQPFIKAWRDFQAKSNFQVQQSERLVYSAGYDYAGTFDLFGVLNNHCALVEIKTGTPPPWVRLQLAAYHHAAVEMRIFKRITKAFCLNLKADGKFSLTDHTRTVQFDFASYYEALLRAKAQEEVCEHSVNGD